MNKFGTESHGWVHPQECSNPVAYCASICGMGFFQMCMSGLYSLASGALMDFAITLVTASLDPIDYPSTAAYHKIPSVLRPKRRSKHPCTALE